MKAAGIMLTICLAATGNLAECAGTPQGSLPRLRCPAFLEWVCGDK